MLCAAKKRRLAFIELHMNRNFIGRDRMMDIAITDDPRLCRQKHLSVTYDRRSDHFYIKNENGSVFVNNSPVQKAMELKENDTIRFGSGCYVFVPYCKQERGWQADENR